MMIITISETNVALMPSTLPILALHYYYSGFPTVAFTALEHFKELIPARHPFTSPGWSVVNLDECLAKGL